MEILDARDFVDAPLHDPGSHQVGKTGTDAFTATADAAFGAAGDDAPWGGEPWMAPPVDRFAVEVGGDVALSFLDGRLTDLWLDDSDAPPSDILIV